MPIDFAKGIATTVVNQGLRKVAGNVPGILGKIRGKQGVRDSSDVADIENAKICHTVEIRKFCKNLTTFFRIFTLAMLIAQIKL